jgi:hippurate hydrolase
MLTALPSLLPGLTELYEDLHAHPELSFAEHRTAAEIARRLKEIGCDVAAGVGRTGVVGMLRNGDGPTVLLRADIDALPVAERTGLPYASSVTATDARGQRVPVMHACGHDLHITWLIGAATLFASHRDAWSGTLMLVFQPAEEIAAGAAAMVDDGLFDRFGRPDVALGQHVFPIPAGTVLYRSGLAMAACDSLHVRLVGRGGHGSRPQATIDPIVLAASTVMRLQTIVSREIAPQDTAVVTVGMLHAGTKENIIPDEAELTVNIRTFEPAVRDRVRASVGRIIRGEAATAGAPEPQITTMYAFDAVTNDETATQRVAGALAAQLGADRVGAGPAVTGSEDFGVFGDRGGFPSVFWFVGGTDPDAYAAAKQAGRLDEDVASNHSPFFAPVLDPTLPTGVQTLVAAALLWLAPGRV